MGYPLKLSQTAQPLLFLMVDSVDHITGKTGLSPTVTLSKNGAAFASPAGAVTEIGSGFYKVAGNATDTGTLGPLALHATGSGADPVDDVFNVVSYDPQSATAFITGVNSLAPPTNWNLHSIDASGRVDVGKVLGTAQTARDLGAAVALHTGTLQAATATTGTLAVGFPTFSLVDQYIQITSGPGRSAVAVLITVYNTGTGGFTIAAWPNGTPDNTSTYCIRPQVAITALEHAEVGADVVAGLSNQLYTSARAQKLDNLDVALSAIYNALVVFPTGTVTGTPTTTSITVTGLTDQTANAYKGAYCLFTTGAQAYAAASPVNTSSYSGGTATLPFLGLTAAPAAGDLCKVVGSLKVT